jgi:hypothetical protein
LLFANRFPLFLQHCFHQRCPCLLHPFLTVYSSADNPGQALIIPQPVCHFSKMLKAKIS